MKLAKAKVVIPSINQLPESLRNLRSFYPSLPKRHQKIADFILSHPAPFLQKDAREIGRYCGTSDATVVRFCQRIGYEGLGAMKKVLAVEMASALSSSERVVQLGPQQSQLDRIFEDCLSTIRETLGGINRQHLIQVAKRMVESDCLYLFGSGLSLHLAQETAEKLVTLRFRASSLTRPDLQVSAAKLCRPEDIVIALTHSGNYVPIVQALEEANKQKAYCVVVTSFRQSLVTKHADMVLYTYPPLRSLIGQSAPRRLAQALILDALVVLAVQLKKKSASMYDDKTLHGRARLSQKQIQSG